MHPRRKNIRLRGYDYSSEGLYFITICTKNRNHYFGHIENQKFDYSPIGAIAYTYWSEIPKHFPNVALGEFVIMPNHTHGIIEILQSTRPSKSEDPESLDSSVRTRHGVSPQDSPQDSSQNIQQESQNKSSEKPDKKSANNLNEFGKTIPGSVSAIIGQFKSSVTRWCNKNGFDFGWHSRFHDHIIRDEPEFYRIENYILNNVKNWHNDKFSE